MSGIAAIWNRDGRLVDPAIIAQMTQLMEHRGPDGERHWIEGAVAFGHRALNTTRDIPTGIGLLCDETVGSSLTFDGRIDNRDELISLLDRDKVDRENTDEELVLAAYRKWGDECPTRLLGDFAFAIWDARRRQLFCARDPLGVRPLFHTSVGSTFVCASEIRALFALQGLKKEPDLAIVAARLMRKCIEFDDTLYKGIFRVPMAHSLAVTQEGARLKRYWDVDPEHQIRYRRDDDYAERFRDLFFDAVRCRLRSTKPIAAMLSGGLDSSSIACAAELLRRREHINEPNFETFSMVFDRFSLCDERRFINEIVTRSNIKANYYVADQDLAVAAIARHSRYPGLLYSPQGMVLGEMLEGMRDSGFRVMLDGTGGDELAGNGFWHLMALTRHGKWMSLSALVREYASTYNISAWGLFFDTCFKPAFPAPLKALYRRLSPSIRPAPGPGLVREDALERTGAKERMAHPVTIPKFRESVHSEMYTAIFSGWGPTVLTENYELIVSYQGVEMRQPFRDRRLVEFALGLPPNQLWRDGWSRIAFRNAMKGTLPEPILRRRGKGIFGQLYDAVLAESQAGEVRALSEDPVLARMGIADAKIVRKLVDDYQRSPTTNSMLVISDLIALEILCREILGEPVTGATTGADISAKSADQSYKS